MRNVLVGLCALGLFMAVLAIPADGAGRDARRLAHSPTVRAPAALSPTVPPSAAGGVPIVQRAQAPATAQSFAGVAAVGALFTETNGSLGTHFCTASVVRSAAGDLAVTAAHCLDAIAGTVVFVPGYANGREPFGAWHVAQVYTDSAWRADQDPDHDVAFLRLADAANGASVEDVTGAERLGIGTPAGAPVRVIGYPDGAGEPVSCDGVAEDFSPTQLEFDCGGYTDGTSGGPFLADVDAATGQGTVIGVIGGYQQGGDTPQVSYAAVFGSAVAELYAAAEAGGKAAEAGS